MTTKTKSTKTKKPKLKMVEDQPAAEPTSKPVSGELDDYLPSTGLLSFYDRLRDRIQGYLERRAGKLGHGVAEALLLVPDVFMLMARLALDREVPKSTRALLASALAYFVLPIDLLPEAFLGAGGFLDDLVLGLTVLSQTFDSDLEPIVAKHWSGSRSVREVVRDVVGTAHSLLGVNLYERLRDLLKKQGVDLDKAAAEAGS